MINKQITSIRHSFAWMALIILMALTLAACGGQASSGATTPTAAPSASTRAAPTAQPTAGSASTSATQPAAVSPTATTRKLNLNTATAADFLKIPNVGNNMAREFLEYRPYTSILQFRREIGKYISAQQVAEYEKYVYVPINVNSADADTLQQIPGVDKTIAA